MLNPLGNPISQYKNIEILILHIRYCECQTAMLGIRSNIKIFSPVNKTSILMQMQQSV